MSNDLSLIKQTNSKNGADWEFKKFIPDKDDLDVQMRCLQECMNHLKSLNLNDSEEKIHLFVCGFGRGCAWMKDKLMPHIKQLIKNLEREKLKGLRARDIL